MTTRITTAVLAVTILYASSATTAVQQSLLMDGATGTAGTTGTTGSADALSIAGAPPVWPTCVVSGLNQGVVGIRTIDSKTYFVRWMANVFDGAIDDWGATGAGDSLQVFCVARSPADTYGQVAMCLSKEWCPWR